MLIGEYGDNVTHTQRAMSHKSQTHTHTHTKITMEVIIQIFVHDVVPF